MKNKLFGLLNVVLALTISAQSFADVTNDTATPNKSAAESKVDALLKEIEKDRAAIQELRVMFDESSRDYRAIDRSMPAGYANILFWSLGAAGIGKCAQLTFRNPANGVIKKVLVSLATLALLGIDTTVILDVKRWADVKEESFQKMLISTKKLDDAHLALTQKELFLQSVKIQLQASEAAASKR